uniref:DUF4283 domain-containing protein n=1 Tax=Setaria viridis TaxID=4556 RepID=A0A4U6U405_SETVI|nr:hypothetical protein SEVIR_6G154300v2 [Setaria viridis]
MSRLGDPATRPEQVDCLVQATGDIDTDLREWETMAVVTWAVRGQEPVDPRDIERAIREEFRLRHGEVTVSHHFPEAFLIKFKYSHHCTEALQKGKAAGSGVEVYFTKWRSLRDAEGAALLFRVRLCLDGVPMHAWRADIVERLIGSTCALEAIDTNLEQPHETKTIDLWAWTANPSSIPKCAWLTFTGRARDPRLEDVMVSKTPPGQWQRGVKHCVILHLEEIQDYTLASVNLDDRTSCTPSIRRLPSWHLGCIDGETRPRRVERVERQLSPPRSDHPRHGRSSAAGESDRRDEKEDRQRRSNNNDHPTSRWNRNDDDDDRDQHGRGDRTRRAHDAHKVTGGDTGRERDRLPRRRNWDGGSKHGERQHQTQPSGTSMPHQLSLFGPVRDARALELKFLFANRASNMKEAAANFLCRQDGKTDGKPPQLPSLYDYINKAAILADSLHLTHEGDEVWSREQCKDKNSQPTVKVSQAFNRIKVDLAMPGHNSPMGDATTVQELSPGWNQKPPTLASSTPLMADCISPSSHTFLNSPPLEQMARTSPSGTGGLNDLQDTAADPISVQEVDEALNSLQVHLQRITHELPLPLSPSVDRDHCPSNNAHIEQVLKQQDGAATNTGNVSSMIGPTSAVSTFFTKPAQVLQLQTMEAGKEDQTQHQQGKGPVPQDVIAVLTAAFNLDDPAAQELDEAMARVAGEAIEDFQGDIAQEGEGEAANNIHRGAFAAATAAPQAVI